jgi:predicted ATP-grasp superfamily ATP-dependent carboligase
MISIVLTVTTSSSSEEEVQSSSGTSGPSPTSARRISANLSRMILANSLLQRPNVKAPSSLSDILKNIFNTSVIINQSIKQSNNQANKQTTNDLKIN